MICTFEFMQTYDRVTCLIIFQILVYEIYYLLQIQKIQKFFQLPFVNHEVFYVILVYSVYHCIYIKHIRHYGYSADKRNMQMTRNKLISLSLFLWQNSKCESSTVVNLLYHGESFSYSESTLQKGISLLK